jgi:hypothetical protein
VRHCPTPNPSPEGEGLIGIRAHGMME